MIEINKYTKNDKELWNDFLKQSKIDSFLFDRDYMDYHSDKFKDNSYLIYRKGKLVAVLPGNIDNNTFYSHQGLTYGGIISSCKLTLVETLNAFELINDELKNNGVEEVIYKPIPYIYQLIPSQEDVYALFRLNSVKIGCNISSTIFQSNKVPFSELRTRGMKKAIKNNVDIVELVDFSLFWGILEDNLMKTYGKKPVHNLTEISLLKERFPSQIKLYSAIKDSKIIGGTILFIMKKIVHVQYISASEQGKKDGALDMLFDYLINVKYTNFEVFDFGQSTEQMGFLLNENLIFQKEGFGGRGVVYETYKYIL